ncbi:hypothetical protein GMMP15_90035 [Candidatus Magnetomoraceae bacterium gMMP-15]
MFFLIDDSKYIKITAGIGFMFIFLGIFLLFYSDFQPVNKVKILASNINHSSIPAIESCYKLDYDHDSDQWIIKNNNNKIFDLPPIINSLQDFNPTGGCLEFEELQEMLVTKINQDVDLTQEDINSLIAINLDGKHLFSQNFFKIKSKVTTSIKIERKPLNIVSIPPEINPRSDIFKRNMLKWRKNIIYLISKALPDSSNNRINIIYPLKGEDESILLRITRNAGKRILANNFGSENKDKVIYLQYQVVFNGTSILIDGIIGQDTHRKLMAVLVKKVKGNKKVKAEYKKILNKL